MTQEEQPQRGRYGFLILEMVLIVISILAAFALDAWWESRVERRHEVEQLLAMRVELVQSIEHLDEILSSVAEHSGNVDQLFDAIKAAGDSPVVVPRQWLGSVVSWRTSDVSLSTLRSMESSGDLQLVSDPELRAALAGLEAEVYDVVEDEEIGRNFVEYHLGPALARAGLGEAAYTNRLGFRPDGHGGEIEVQPTPELLGMLAARRVHINFSLSQLPQIQTYLRGLIEMIDRDTQADG